MPTRLTALHIIAVLCFLIGGCRANQAQRKATANRQPQPGENQIDIKKPNPTVQPLKSETLDVRNCETTEDLHKSLSDFLPVRKEVSVTEKATAIGSGQTLDIPEAKCRDLVEKVESTYQQEYKQAQAGLQEVEINVPADKIYMYQIQWVDRTYQATISFSMENEAYETSYTYKLKVPQIDGSKQMSCTA